MEKLHILIIPSLLYQTEYLPVAGIFQKHQADCLNDAGHRVGVLSAGLIPFKGVLKPNRFKRPVMTDENGVKVVRRYAKAHLPQRYIAPATQVNAMCDLGMAAYEKYEAAYGRPDVVHVHDCLYAGVLAQKLKAVYGLPYVVTEHSTLHQRGLYTIAQLDMIHDVLRQASVVTVVGSGLYNQFQKRFGDIDTVKNASIIFNLLDRDFEAETTLPPKHDAGNGTFLFLNVAHLVEQKAQINLVRAMPAVLQRFQNVELRIGGAGTMQTALEQAIMSQNLSDHVKLLGLLGRDQVKQQMAECNAFALSSRVETFGVVLIEAMALGKPVIATICGGPEDFVDETSGYLIPTGDVDALAAAMVKMVENIGNFQPEKIRAHCIERFGKDAFIKRLEEVYEKALGKQAEGEFAEIKLNQIPTRP